ncbi:MAG: AraC family transcriptional regulator [Lentisphaeria bacterium]
MFQGKKQLMYMPRAVYLSRIFYSNEYARNFHADINNEVLHIIHGKIVLKLKSGLEYHATRHDTLFIPHGVCHRDVFEANHNLEIFHINFSWANADEFFQFASPNCLASATPLEKMEVSLLFDMFRLDDYKNGMNQQLADARLAHLLAIAWRSQNVKQDPMPGGAKPLVAEAKLFLLGHIDEPLNINRVASYLEVSRSTLSRAFRITSGMSFNEYLTAIRMQRAQIYLREGRISIADCAAQVGYNDPSYFSCVFKKHFRVSPRQMK